MTVHFVTRHPGALAWARSERIAFDRHARHLDPETVDQGDVVISNLPVHVAASVCARGARYVHLALDLPCEARGVELTVDELFRYDARLEEYRLERAT